MRARRALLVVSGLLTAGLAWYWQTAGHQDEGQFAASVSPASVSAASVSPVSAPEGALSVSSVPRPAERTADAGPAATDPVASPQASNPFSVPVEEAADAPTGFALSSLPLHSTDQRISFAELMADVALDDSNEDVVGSADIELSYSPLVGTRAVPWPADLGQFERIYAHIMSASDCRPCFIKWQHTSSGDIQYLTTITLNANRWETAYLTPETGWETGSYVLSVLDATPARRLLGRTSLRVSAVREGEYPREPDAEYVQALLNTGRAVAKLARVPVAEDETQEILPDYALIQTLVDSGRATMKTLHR